MRLTHMSLLVFALLSGTVFVGAGGPATAQEVPHTDHPAVGTWLIDLDPGDPNDETQMAVVSADGTLIEISASNGTAGGQWAPTGPSTVNATLYRLTDGPAYVVIRASLEIAADGNSFTGTFTQEMVFDPADGGTSGEIGPGTVAGTRVVAEGPGTPVATFEEFFPPEATPAS